MRYVRRLLLPLLLAALAVTGTTVTTVSARTIGQAIDDATLVAKVKTKLAADQLSNLTKIGVKADQGVVTLSGTVDSVERRARAVDIASAVSGVKTIVNEIDVVPPGGATASSSGTTSSGTVTTTQAPVDATGTIASVNPQTGTLTLTDGRVLHATDRTLVWQPTTLAALRPGTEVLVRDGQIVAFGPGTPGAAASWRMGTISRVDTAAGELVLTDGTVVRVTAATAVHRGSEVLTLGRLTAGTEIAVLSARASSGSPAEGSALPRQTAVAPVVDAAEVQVLWTPPSASR